MKFKYLLFSVCCLFFCLGISYVYSQSPQYRTHTVSQGETVYSIASSYNVTVEDIYRLNPATRNRISINQVIYIPQPASNNISNTGEYILHSIQQNETLYSVSKKYNISIEQIQAANPGLNSTNFKIGTAIRIPKIESSNATVTNVLYSGNDYKTHTVQGKETLYSLSKQYGISMQEIADANPEIKTEGLKQGAIIRIPAGSSRTAGTNPNIAPEDANNPTHLQNIRKENNLQIGLLLPFLSSEDYMKARFVEYYEGFLLAVEDMKKKGFSSDIYVFDIRKGNDTKKLESLLETTEIKNLDLIIGGVSDEEVALLSRFAEDNAIKYVVPFPIRNNSVIVGYNTYLANIPQADLFSKAAKKFTELFNGQNIILISDTNKDKEDFIKEIERHAQGNYNTTIRNIQIGDINSQIKDALSLTKKNVIVPSSSNLVSLSKVIPVLRNIKSQYPAVELSLFGYPDWQAYYSQFLPEFFNYDAYIYTPFYADNSDIKIQNFYQRFRKWYNKELMNTYPKYGLLGYDTGLYFLTALAEEKNTYEQDSQLMRTETLQSTFFFERTNNQKGYINTGLFFIHYNPVTKVIEKIDYSR